MDGDLRERAMAQIHSAVLSPEYVLYMSQGDLHKVWSKLIDCKQYMHRQPSFRYGSYLETCTWEEMIRYYLRLADIASTLYCKEDLEWCYANIITVSESLSPQMTDLYRSQYYLALGQVSKARSLLSGYSNPKGITKLFRKAVDLPSDVLAKAFLLKCKAFYLIDDYKSLGVTVLEFEKYLSSIQDGLKNYYDLYVEAYLYYANLLASDQSLKGNAEKATSIVNMLTGYIKTKGLSSKLSCLLLQTDVILAYNRGDFKRLSSILSFLSNSAQMSYGDGTLQHAIIQIFFLAVQTKVYGMRYDREYHTSLKLFDDGIFTGRRVPWLNHYYADSRSVKMWQDADVQVRKKVFREFEYYKNIVSWVQPFVIEKYKTDLKAELGLKY